MKKMWLGMFLAALLTSLAGCVVYDGPGYYGSGYSYGYAPYGYSYGYAYRPYAYGYYPYRYRYRY